MPSGILYGDLEQKSSIGHTSTCPPVFITPSIFGYISGNSINFVETKYSTAVLTKPSDINQSQDLVSEIPSIVAKSQITAFAAFPAESLIAYAQKRSTLITILKWPQLTPVGVNKGTLQAPNDLEIVSLCFSNDGQYLASLGSLPHHSLCVWDWRGIVFHAGKTEVQLVNMEVSPLLCSTTNFGPATSISFNPLDKRMICTSNPGGGNARVGTYPNDEFDLEVEVGASDTFCKGIRFWKIIMGYKKWDIVPIAIKSEDSNTSKSNEKQLLPPTHSSSILNPYKENTEFSNPVVALGHVWRSDQSVVVATNKNFLMLFYPTKGTHRILEVERQFEYIEEKTKNSNPLMEFDINEDNSIGEAVALKTMKESQILSVRTLLYAKDIIIAAGTDGQINLIKTDKANPAVSKQLYLKSECETNNGILSLTFSPTFKNFLIEFEDGSLSMANTNFETFSVVSNTASTITCIDTCRLSSVCVAGCKDGNILVFDKDEFSVMETGEVEKGHVLAKTFKLPGSSITAIAMSPFASSLVAVGTKEGYLRLYNLNYRSDLTLFANSETNTEANVEQNVESNNVENETDKNLISDTNPSLLFIERLYSVPISKLIYDPTGKYLLAFADQGKAFVLDFTDKIKLSGFVEYSGKFQSAAFNLEGFEEEEKNNVIYLYILSSEEASGCSFIHRFILPISSSDIILENNSLQISKYSLLNSTYRIESLLVDIALLPTQLSSGRETFYVLSKERKLMTFIGPQQPGVSQKTSGGTATATVMSASSATSEKKESTEKTDAIIISKPLMEITQHEKGDCFLKKGYCIDWLITWSKDGNFVVKSLIEPDKEVRVLAHDPFCGGIKDLALTPIGDSIITLGNDGLLKFWRWRFTTGGKKTEADAILEWQRYIALKENVIRATHTILKTQKNIEDVIDSPNEQCLSNNNVSPRLVQEKVDLEKEQYTTSMNQKIAAIRERVAHFVLKNETLPSLEKIDKEEFVLDFQERDRLLAEADAKINNVKRNIESLNLKKVIIQKRIKKECWDSMKVIGQSVKSFNPDTLTGKIIEVTNYPIRILSSKEIKKANEIKMLRKIQVEVGKESNPKQKQTTKEADLLLDDDLISSDNTGSESKPDTLQVKEPTGIAALLYNPFDLITNERRRMQSILLNEYIYEQKTQFNNNFLNFATMKQDGISKIEEKNERIKSIMDELQIQEAILHPELDDDEVPERIIQVLDSEVKFEKFITLEEKKKMEEKRIQEEDRLKLQKQDNWAERALNQMMGGRLEDRSDQEEKEELVRPEWMNKPKEEMSEEERKLVKEFEKKLATFKEEQEKYKKALETELRKLQSSIVEVCENFDKSLNEFFNSKLETDQLIFQTELKLIKLNLSSVFSENDEAREEEILTRLEQLKNEKTSYVTEIPEIKKDLERCREEYEQVMKKDKEMDKIFKKEFHNYDFYFDNLMKLFKKRETQATLNLESDDSIQDHNKLVIINPFSQIEKSSVWEDPLPLNIEVDLPEGISMELWQKLVELRDRKIALEKEVFIAFNRFQEMQTLVQAVLDESERIKQETDVLTSDLNQFLEYKFHSTYNVENLFQLKQGQVEISQEPVVTDYSDAVLIHRGQVERLNESIAGLGKSKVDALKEMKEYRKGIHALEWENKMLDFQADDAIIRTRDIQLLRLTKQMQEYLRSGDEYAQTTEIIALEKRAEYSQKAHLHKLEEKNRSLHKLKKKILEKSTQNEDLDKELEGLEKTVKERNEIFQSSSKHNQAAKSDNNKLNEIYTRRRLVDLAKGQAQDIAILREEVERLRLRTYPAFSASKRRAF